MRLAALLGKFVLLIATMALLIGASLFFIGSTLTALPLMRLTPSGRRIRAAMGTATALMILARAFQSDEAGAEVAPKS